MPEPRFSVVIPTRERADTLPYALRTCLAQDFESFEVVVCDNCSSPDTGLAVHGLASDRIKYVRSDRPLAMSENWELAVSHASGEYVIVIGDDDGLLPHALRGIDELLTALRVKALRWERVYYTWPSWPVPADANVLRIPLNRRHAVLRAADVIPRIANRRMNYTMLPMFYNSAVHRDLIGKLRQRTGRVFGAASPDIYSGFAFAYLAGSYPSSGLPMTINGGSAKSTGLAHMGPDRESPGAEEFRTLNVRAGMALHPQVPDMACMPAGIADAFLRARDALFPGEAAMHIDRRELAANCLKEVAADTEEEWRSRIQAVRDSLSDDAALLEWFDAEFAARPFQADRGETKPGKKGFDGYDLHLDASQFGVTDVLGAAHLCESILGYARRSFEWPREPAEPGRLGPWRRLRTAARILLKGK